MNMYLKKLYLKLAKFNSDAQKILSLHESSHTRIITLEKSYSNLSQLNIKQDELFRQALRCIENSLFRAAHVLSWAAFMDFVENKLAEDGYKKLNKIRPNWRIKNIEDLRENIAEYQIIDSLQLIGLCTKTQKKALHGLLNKRNECAHPTDYFPELNETLGFISELLKRIKGLQDKLL